MKKTIQEEISALSLWMQKMKYLISYDRAVQALQTCAVTNHGKRRH